MTFPLMGRGREPEAVGGSGDVDEEGREDLVAERARARSTRCEVPPMARPMPDPRVKARAATWVVRIVRAYGWSSVYSVWGKKRDISPCT